MRDIYRDLRSSGMRIRTNSAGMRKQNIASGAQEWLADAWGRVAFNYYNWRQVGRGSRLKYHAGFALSPSAMSG